MRLVVGVVNTNPEITEWLFQRFAGSVNCRAQPSGHRRPIFMWYLSGLEAKQFVQLIQHALVAKRQHGQIVARLAVRFDTVLLTETERAQMAALNAGDHLQVLYGDLGRWRHMGRLLSHRRRLSIIAHARKLCPACHDVFGPHKEESLRAFWNRLYCSVKCMGRARSHVALTAVHGILREGKA